MILFQIEMVDIFVSQKFYDYLLDFALQVDI
jgi:hypothetical protein